VPSSSSNTLSPSPRSPKRLLNECPEMFAFPRLETIFTTIASRIKATVHTDRKVVKVVRRTPSAAGQRAVTVTDDKGNVGHFDEVSGIRDCFDMIKELSSFLLFCLYLL
jgi:hypothetical protein